jgi:hypothetical protein
MTHYTSGIMRDNSYNLFQFQQNDTSNFSPRFIGQVPCPLKIGFSARSQWKTERTECVKPDS